MGIGATKKAARRASNATCQLSVTVDNASGAPIPTPRRRAKHIRLKSVADVKDELARVYRATKAGEIPPEVGSRLTFILGTLGKLIAESEFEARIVALEGRIPGKQKGLGDETRLD